MLSPLEALIYATGTFSISSLNCFISYLGSGSIPDSSRPCVQVSSGNILNPVFLPVYLLECLNVVIVCGSAKAEKSAVCDWFNKICGRSTLNDQTRWMQLYTALRENISPFLIFFFFLHFCIFVTLLCFRSSNNCKFISISLNKDNLSKSKMCY